jgi:hypothetical protein
LNEKTIEKKPRITTAIVETNKPSLSSLTNSLKCSFTLKIKRGHSANQRHIMIPGHKQCHIESFLKPL